MGMFLKTILFFMLSYNYIYALCSNTPTIANEPLLLINHVCIDENLTKPENIVNISTNGKHVVVSRGALGFIVFEIKHIDYPIADSIYLSKVNSISSLSTYAIVDQDDNIYSTSDSKLSIYSIVKNNNKKDYITLKQRSNLDMNVTYMYHDKRFLYIGGPSKIKIYTLSGGTLSYEYNDIDGYVTGMDSVGNVLYVTTSNNKVEEFAKNYTDNHLVLNKIKYNGYVSDNGASRIHVNKKYIVSYATPKNAKLFSQGAYSSIKEITPKAFSNTNTNTKTTTKTTTKTNKTIDNINEVYSFNSFDVISSENGLFVQNENIQTYDDVSSLDIDVYDEFIFVLEKVALPANTTEIKLRVYKFNSVVSSVVYGQAPLSVDFSVNSLNVKDVQWLFEKDISVVKSTKAQHVYLKAGLYRVKSIITYESGRKYIHYIDVIVKEDNTFDYLVIASKLSGSAPLKVDFQIKMKSKTIIKSVQWDFGEKIKAFSSKTSHIFKKDGKFDVKVTVKNIDDVEVSKTIKINVKKNIKAKIKIKDNKDSVFMNENVDLSIDLTQKQIDDLHLVKAKWLVDNIQYATNINKFTLKHKFTSAGIHTIKLLLYDMNATEYKLEKTINVFDYSKPIVSINRLSGETPLKLDFNIKVSKNSPYELNHIKWTLPNKKTSFKHSESYEISSEGLFYINYEYVLSSGAFYKNKFEVNVSNNFDIKLKSSKTMGLVPFETTVEYFATSRNGIKEYIVNFDDGTGDIKTTDNYMSHAYTQAKDYVVTVTAISNKGNTNIAKLLVNAIEVNVKTDSSKSDLNKYLSNSIYDVDFNITKSNDYSLQNFYIDFGDSNAPSYNKENVRHRYRSSRAFLATLKMDFKDLVNNKMHKEEKLIFVNPPKIVGNYNVVKGWNLIGNPTKTIMKTKIANHNFTLPIYNYLDMDLYSKHSDAIWIYKNHIMTKNPDIISSGYAMWIKMKYDYKLPFYGDTFVLNFDDINKGWSLLASGKVITKDAYKDFKAIYIYNAKEHKWIKNPERINPSQGFMVLK